MNIVCQPPRQPIEKNRPFCRLAADIHWKRLRDFFPKRVNFWTTKTRAFFQYFCAFWTQFFAVFSACLLLRILYSYIFVKTHLEECTTRYFFLLRAPFGQYGPVAAFELYLYTAVDSRPGPGGSRTTASCQP